MLRGVYFALMICFLMPSAFLSIRCSNNKSTTPESAEYEWQIEKKAWIVNGIGATMDNNLFAVGNNGLILELVLGEWMEMENEFSTNLIGVWGVSKSNIFATGYSGTILHYDGHTWSKMQCNTTQSFNNIWGSSSDDVYAVAYNGLVFHYNGNLWTRTGDSCSQMLRAAARCR